MGDTVRRRAPIQQAARAFLLPPTEPFPDGQATDAKGPRDPPDRLPLPSHPSDDLRTALPWAADCALPVELVLSRDVADGAARYAADEQLIEIEIPTSPRRFRESLVHELGHHIDATCGALADLRAEFLTVQGFSPSASWATAETWATTPAEHFAEAVVEIVNGERLLHDDRIDLSSESLELVRRGP